MGLVLEASAGEAAPAPWRPYGGLAVGGPPLYCAGGPTPPPAAGGWAAAAAATATAAGGGAVGPSAGRGSRDDERDDETMEPGAESLELRLVLLCGRSGAIDDVVIGSICSAETLTK